MKSSSNPEKKKYSSLAEMDYAIFCDLFGVEKAKQIMLLCIEKHKESEKFIKGIKSTSS